MEFVIGYASVRLNINMSNPMQSNEIESIAVGNDGSCTEGQSYCLLTGLPEQQQWNSSEIYV